MRLVVASPLLHPACLLFPPLSDAEIRQLADDIKQNGLLNPIVLFEGKVLDGRNRLKACRLAGMKPQFTKWTGQGSPLAWVVSTNLVRRHLTASQRAVVAFNLLPLLEKEAKQRQRLSSGRGKKGAKHLATFSDNGKASQIAARITKSNSLYVEKLKSISKKAPEVIPDVKSGRITVLEATKIARIDNKERNKVLAEIRKSPDDSVKRITRRVLMACESAPPTQRGRGNGSVEIWCGDCVKLMREKIANESISIVTSSPPYNQGVPYGRYNDNRSEADYLAWLAEVFTELRRVLRPDGSFFLNVGHSALKPWTAMRVAEAAGKLFTLQNHIIWAKSISVDGRSRGHFKPLGGDRFLNRSWESIFHFSKAGKSSLDRLAVGVPYEYQVNKIRTGSSLRCAGDLWFIPHETVHGTEDRSDHPATFPAEIAERCIRLAGIKADTFVLDPFCGVNGMIAAARLGVRGVGIDIDPAYCRAARRRLVSV